VHLIEGNYQGQLGQYISAITDHKFKGKLLKYNGRPFFVEDLKEYLDNNL
jgi:pyruvate/2-oxoacid:ferredoxin oxidoreductase alpha subunit